MITLINNRKTHHDYFILESYMAGIQLLGSEVKSIKDSRASISEAYCQFNNNELFLKNMHVSDYKNLKHINHEPLRDRKLLLQKNELKKLLKATTQKGFSIIPLAIKLSKTGFVKIEIGLAKGKKSYNKKDAIKEKDIERELKRN